MEVIISRECRINKDDLTAFAHEGFLDCKGDDYGYIYGMDDGVIVLYIAFVLKTKFFFCLAELQTQVICLQNSFVKMRKDFLEKGLYELHSKYNVDFICQNPAYAIYDIYPEKAIYTYFGTYKCDLKKSKEELWSNIHSKHKNVIRKAQKNKVDIKFNNIDIKCAYKLIYKTQIRNNNSFISEDKFIDLNNRMFERIDVISAHYKDKVQGCAIIVHDNNSAYYLYGGSCEKTFPGALNYMHWQVMLHYKQQGLSFYDFVGARLSEHISGKIQGIQRFKSRFGGTLYKGVLWKFVFHKKKYILYKLVMFLKNKHWAVDAIDEENITNI